MELTAIKISKETQKKLNLIKYNLGLKSIDEVITKLLKITSKIDLASDSKSMKGGK